MKQRLVLTPETQPGMAALGLEDGSLLPGRAPSCGGRFDAGDVSARHALVCAHPSGFYVADQQSRNGTWVNAQRVETAWLQHGDVLRLGSAGPALRVQIEAAQQAALDGAAYAALQKPPAALPHTSEVVGSATLARTLDRAAVKAIKPPRSRAGTAQYVLAGLVCLGLAGVIALMMLLELGVVGLIVGGIAAFLPAPFYASAFVWLDRYDREPPAILAAAFAWGALFALFVSFVGNTVFGITAAALISEPAGDFLTGVVSAPLVEEGTKGLGLLVLYLGFRRYFDGVVDGVVYAGLIALGFATVENVQYYGRQFLSDGAGGLLALGILRGVLSPFSHALFTGMTGVGFGIARETSRPALRWIAPAGGLMMAVLLHSLWNFVASIGSFFAVYFAVWLPLFMVCLGLLTWLSRRERRIIAAMLEPEVAAGLLTREQADIVGSYGRRFSWIVGAGSRRAARREFLATATRLAMSYWHVARANEAGEQTTSLPNIPALRLQLHALAATV